MSMFRLYTDPAGPGAQPETPAEGHSPAAGAAYDKAVALIEEIRPYVQEDGGDVEPIKLEDGVLYVRLVGACVGCPSSLATLKNGIEMRIKEAIPEIASVEMI